ncbi:MAG TPA: hypothetical protein VGL10_05455, partial [Gammaproteobacteria bacterium]
MTGFARKLVAALCLSACGGVFAADHNDPNAVNSIYADVPISGADLYDIFGYPSAGGESLIVQLTFAPLPATGVFDRELMYKIHLDAAPRISDYQGDESLEGMIAYFEALKDQFLNFATAYIKVSFNDENQAKIVFNGFPGGDFHEIVDTNTVAKIATPRGQLIKAFIGGRDDAFFNTLHGFFRSINYAPQFYKVPVADYQTLAELPIPKTLLELEGNDLFNFDPAHPLHGKGEKYELPPGPYEWKGDKFLKDANGNFRFVYNGEDDQAGRNINTLSFEIPLTFLSESPETERIVRLWGESYVLKASSKIAAYAPSWWQRLWLWIKSLFQPELAFNDIESDYNQVDHDGVPFSDAALSLRYDDHLGPNNIKFLREFTTRFAHLGWGFGPSISALGLPTCFNHDNSPVSVHKIYKLAIEAFPRVKKCFFQPLNMPDNSWNTSGKNIPLKRTFEVFIPNLTSVDMDTNGTWPYGRRPEDQVATRFLATFLDMSANCGAQPCHIETLNDPALWEAAPIEPKTVPNPRFNDKEFL